MAGFPVAFVISRREDDTGEFYVQPLVPEMQGETFASCIERYMGLEVSLQGSTKTSTFYALFDDKVGYGIAGFFEKSWEEVVKEKSSYFPEGEMAVTLTLKKMTKNDD